MGSCVEEVDLRMMAAIKATAVHAKQLVPLLNEELLQDTGKWPWSATVAEELLNKGRASRSRINTLLSSGVCFSRRCHRDYH